VWASLVHSGGVPQCGAEQLPQQGAWRVEATSWQRSSPYVVLRHIADQDRIRCLSAYSLDV
jgi:hypothetical protein